MNLDDVQQFKTYDPAGMLAEIDSLPEQLEAAWKLGQKLPLGDISGVRQVVLAGMGGSAIGADLLAAYAAPMASAPFIVWRDYDLPAFALEPGTLVVACSHSGNTEETLSAFAMALEADVDCIAVSTGGKLGETARDAGRPFWAFEHAGQPRAAVGYSFGLLLALVSRLGLLPDPEDELQSALEAMQVQREMIQADSPVSSNPAKRMAGQLVGRWPVILGAGVLAPVARRWRTQIAELAKALAQFEALPEADHNMVAGVMRPEALFGCTMALFLQGAGTHERNQRRVEITRSVLMVEGFNTDVIVAEGETRLAQQWTSLHFGDYTAYYLAMAYGIDPTPVEAIEDLKRQLS
ncbi:MAG: bifunctional phosphoglucose/phosphomannose isomerase [Anaerolineales bacterium]|jgi:glucose/mannose-6-phosphate isomerase